MKFYLNYNCFLEVIMARTAMTTRTNFEILNGNIDVVATEGDNAVQFRFTDLDDTVILTYNEPRYALVLESGRAIVCFKDILKTAQKCKWKDGIQNYALFDDRDITTSLGGRWQPKLYDILEYPEINTDPQLERSACTLIRAKDLAVTAVCASKDETRKEFTGVLVDETGGLCATDGHRLFHWDGSRRECGKTPWHGIISRGTIAMLGKLYESSDILNIEPTDDGAKVVISTDSNPSVRVIAKLVNGQFPDLTKVVPNKLDNSRRIDNPTELVKRLRLEAKVVSKSGTMCVKADGETIKTLPSGGKLPIGKLFEPAEGTGDIAVNINYIADAIQQLVDATGADTLVWEWTDADSPTVLRAEDTSTPTAVVMPMQW